MTKWLRAVGYVQTAPDFHDNTKVVNGFSDLIIEIWGDAGRHARSAPGQGPSPLNGGLGEVGSLGGSCREDGSPVSSTGIS